MSFPPSEADMALQQTQCAPDLDLDDARELLRSGRASEAFAQADALLRRDPDDAAAWAFVAGALGAMGETEFAALACARAAQLAPEAADLRVELGRLREALGRPFEAAAAYEDALALVPSPTARVAAHVALSGLHGRAGKFAPARAHAEAGLALDPNHQGALQNLAAICDHEGRVEKAEAFRARLSWPPFDRRARRQTAPPRSDSGQRRTGQFAGPAADSGRPLRQAGVVPRLCGRGPARGL